MNTIFFTIIVYFVRPPTTRHLLSCSSRLLHTVFPPSSLPTTSSAFNPHSFVQTNSKHHAATHSPTMSAFTVPLKTAPPSQIPDIPDSDFDYGLDEALLLEETSQNQTSQPSLVSATLPPPSDPTINPHLAAAAITAEVESAKKHINNPSLDPQNTSHYILGTLIVRVISGRNIPAAYAGGLSQVFTGGSTSTQKKNAQPRSQRVLRMLSSGTSNPYCKVTFDSTSQNLQQVFDTLDPNFTRESLFFDVKLPTKDLALVESFEPPSSILTVDLLHTDQENVKGKKGIKKSQGEVTEQSVCSRLVEIRINYVRNSS